MRAVIAAPGPGLASAVAGAAPSITGIALLILVFIAFRDTVAGHQGLLLAFTGLFSISLAVAVHAIRRQLRFASSMRALQAHAEALARGDLTARLEIPGHAIGEGCRDEIDQVANALNILTAQHAQQISERERYETQLRALNADLQSRIDERTRQLEDAQAQILRVEKRLALGQLVAGIAHEINNNVNAITSAAEPLELGAIDLLRLADAWNRVTTATPDELHGRLDQIAALERELDLPTVRDELQTSLRQMRDGAARIRSIVANLRTFSHRGSDDFQTVPLEPLIRQALSLVQHRLHEQIEVRLNPQSLPPVPCLPVPLTQVLANLLLNAADAVGETGAITISLWRDGPDVKISVRDTGPGIPPEHLSKVFDPFFTTKRIGQGTGLGLYVSQQIMEEHHGGIGIESIPGQGTEVTLHWPARCD